MGGGGGRTRTYEALASGFTVRPPREEIIDAQNVVAAIEQLLAQMQAKKSRAPSHEDALSSRHFIRRSPANRRS
jgi:hypothetical protein